MLAILRSVLVDIVFIVSIVGVLFAGMRGFGRFFPIALGFSFLYLLLMIVRSIKRKKSASS
jgi:hypothetical protein